MKNMYDKKHFRPAMFMRFFVFAVMAVLLFGLIVMLLWNAILPSLIGVGAITYWKAVGLLVLSKILFSSFKPGGGNHRRPPFMPPMHMREKFMSMTDEERRQFREQWKQRCSPQPPKTEG